MNTERFKSFALFSLVIMSFVLTTRIWFDISIEGLFVMPSKDKTPYQLMTTYEKENLLKPNKVVVHMDENYTLLFNNQENHAYYSSILKGSNEIIKDLLINKENYTVSNIGIDQLQKVREGNTVELIFNAPFKLEYIKSLFNVEENLWNDVGQVTSIIISPIDNKIYIIDQSKAVIHQFTAVRMSNSLENTIAEIKLREDFAYVSLNVFNEEDFHIYGEYAIAPVSIVSMPVLTVKREVETNIELSGKVAELFNDESDKISSISDIDGTVTFSDREEETVKVYADGVFEYYKYNVTSDDIRNTDMVEAIDIAISYISKHFGFDGDFYLSEVESRPQGGRNSYIVRFDYRYNGMPVITETESSKSAIEVEIVGQEVKRYKRNVRKIVQEVETVQIMTFDEILDMVQGGLDNYLNIKNSESITKINDLYLAYYGDDELIPVWVVNVDIKSNISDVEVTNQKTYIIGAEEGAILGEQ